MGLFLSLSLVILILAGSAGLIFRAFILRSFQFIPVRKKYRQYLGQIVTPQQYFLGNPDLQNEDARNYHYTVILDGKEWLVVDVNDYFLEKDAPYEILKFRAPLQIEIDCGLSGSILAKKVAPSLARPKI